MKKEQPNKNVVPFMRVSKYLKRILIDFANLFLARKYAALKKSRHHRSGKQHSLDDDEEDIGMCVKNARINWHFLFLDNAFNRGRGTGVERQDRPRTFSRRWHIQQRVIK